MIEDYIYGGKAISMKFALEEMEVLKRKIELLEGYMEGEGFDPEKIYESNKKYIWNL